VEAILAPQIKSGRAVMAVVPRYALERAVPSPPPIDQRTPVWFRNAALLYIAEFRMALDYLESREDIDMQRIAHIGFSWGAERSALILIAVEPRIRSAILMGAELDPRNALPEVNVVNFVPRIKVPTLVLNGRYDEELPFEPNGRALFELLPEPKRLELVESGHLPPIEIRSPIINEFLDETLGPVARQAP
jgi:pimeloyl-ACP methyl ester carboxylesterase